MTQHDMLNFTRAVIWLSEKGELPGHHYTSAEECVGNKIVFLHLHCTCLHRKGQDQSSCGKGAGPIILGEGRMGSGERTEWDGVWRVGVVPRV